MDYWAPGFRAEKIRSERYWRYVRRYVIFFFYNFHFFSESKFLKKGMRISYLRELAF